MEFVKSGVEFSILPIQICPKTVSGNNLTFEH